MSILGSIRLSPKTIARLGNVQVQPTRNTSSPARTNAFQATSTTTRGKTTSSNIPLLRLTGITRTRSKVVRTNATTLSSVASNMINNNNFLLPSFTRNFTTIRPAYKSIVKPKRVYRRSPKDDTFRSPRKFEPYEQLTGISSERPEVILLSEFKPLFIDSNSRFQQYPYYDQIVETGIRPFMTDAGNFVDAQINSRNLRSTNVIHMFRGLRRRNFHFHNVYSDRRAKLRDSMNDLNSVVWFLINVVRKIDTLKEQLDLRDDIHKVNSQAVIKRMGLTFTQARASWLFNTLQKNAAKYLPESYDITDVLTRLGYNQTHAKELFSSTKLWLQMLEEYKDILHDQSFELLDIDPVSARNDTSATVLNRKDTKTFGLSDQDPKDLPFLNEIVGFSPTNIRAATKSVASAFSSIYAKGANFKSEETRIAALANIVSKEFAYSRGLATPSVRRTLSDTFDFTVNDGPTSRSVGERTARSRVGNLRVFDNVIGRFTRNVVDIPLVDTNSLASLASFTPSNNVGVLPFESKFIEGSQGTITPGSKYYVDELLNLRNIQVQGALQQTRGNTNSQDLRSGPVFNTTRLEQLQQTLTSAEKGFATIVDGLNLYGVSEFDSTERSSSSVGSTIGNLSAFVERIVEMFVDNKGTTIPAVRRDRLTSIFALARRNRLLRAQLFLFYMNRIARSYSADSSRSVAAPIVGDNTPFTDEMTKNILDTVFDITKSSRLSLNTREQNIKLPTRGDSNDLTNSVLESSLRKGTQLSRRIESLMKNILDEFSSDLAISAGNDRTLYGGRMDTVMMMIVFDMIVTIVARYGNQVITDRTISGRTIRGGRTTTYLVSQRDINYRSAVNDLFNRVRREQSLVQQITWCILNTLGSLSDEITEFVNYMNNSTSVSRLRALSDVIDDDEELRQLMSEQQIMMLGSTAFDLIGKFQNPAHHQSFGGDADRDGDFDTDDELTILDDSAVPPVVRDALYGFMNLPDNSGNKAINKKILTVGLPLGFATKLAQRVKIQKQKRTSFVEKQNDIIEIAVYKLDLLNQDIVFRPLKFLFELSRFPVRNENYWKPLPDNPTLEDVVAAVPTRDFEESFEEGNVSIAYWKPNNESETNTRVALDAESYSFLSDVEKADIIENHITSHMCEIYLKLLTGISTGEHAFDIELEEEKDVRPVELEFVKLIVNHRVSNITKFLQFNQQSLSRQLANFQRRVKTVKPKGISPSPGLLFNNLQRTLSSTSRTSTRHSLMSSPRLSSFSGIASRVRPVTGYTAVRVPAVRKKSKKELERSTLNLSANLSNISHRKMYSAVHALRNISYFSRMKTSLSDGLAVQKDIVRPKQFDRIFNLLIDPDDFEIDFDKTLETEFGRESFRQLVKRGEITPAANDKLGRALRKRYRLRKAANSGFKARARFAQGELSRLDVDNFLVRERDRGEGDVSFEKYFVVVNTYGEEDV